MHQVLRQAELLSGFGEDAIGRLDAIVQDREFGSGEYLFLLGADADRMYVVLDGSVELCFPLSLHGEMRDTAVEHLGPGRALGWSALVKPYRFTLSARAAGATTVAAFKRQDMVELFEDDPHLGCGFMSRIAELVGHRLLKMEAMWAREFQRTVAEVRGAPAPPGG